MGLFDSFKKGLQKTRDFLSNGLTKAAANLGHFDEEQLDDLEMLLLQSDAGTEATSLLMEEVKSGIRETGNQSKEAVLNSLRKGMRQLLGEETALEVPDHQLTILLMVGVNGTGKTTTSGKLAWYYRQQGKKVVLAAADTFRAAAVKQLLVWGERSDVTVIADASATDPASIVFNAVHAALNRQADLLIVDTAGRLHTKHNLMEELSKVRRVAMREAPDAHLESLLVVDATSGQNAVIQAQAFGEVCPLTGLIVTKLDGNAKGGIILAVAKQSGLPIYFAGLGEEIDSLQPFKPDIYVESLLSI